MIHFEFVVNCLVSESKSSERKLLDNYLVVTSDEVPAQHEGGGADEILH